MSLPNTTFDTIDELGPIILKHMIEIAIDAQGFQPTEFESMSSHNSKTTLKIQTMMGDSIANFASGLKVLSTDENEKTSEFSSALETHLNDPEAFRKKLQEIGEKAETPFAEAVARLFNKGDFHRAREACAVLNLLYPFNPETIALTGSIACEIEGRQAASNFYDQIVQVFEHPMTNFFAADCFYEQGHKERAHKLLTRALSLCDEGMDPAGAYQPMIRDFLNEVEF